IAALFTRICSAPKRSTAAATARRASAPSLTSPAMEAAVPPSAVMALAVASAARPSISRQSTSAPSRAKALLMARPMPLPAPVTIATFRSSLGPAIALAYTDLPPRAKVLAPAAHPSLTWSLEGHNALVRAGSGRAVPDRGRHRSRGERRQFRSRRLRDARHRRRVRLRQKRDQPGHYRTTAPVPGKHSGWPHPLRWRRSGRLVGPKNAGVAWARNCHRLSRSDDLAQSSAQDRFPADRGSVRAPEVTSAGSRKAGSRTIADSRDSGPGEDHGVLSASIERRHAAAGDDRDGACAVSAAFDRRRADDRA